MSVSKWEPAATMEAYYSALTPGATPMGTIAIPVRDHINSATVTSIMGTDFSWVPPGQSINRWIIQGSILTMQRNEAVQRLEGDWLLFIDDDMVWRPDAVKRILDVREEHDLDVVGGLCFRRSDPYQPTLYMRETPTSGAYNYLEKWDTDLVEVDATGLAFCLIHRRVFERIAGEPMPPVADRTRPALFFQWNGTLGEDLWFCQMAKASGSRIWVDTRIKIGHVGEMEFAEENYLYALARREPEVEAERRKINDYMGLPTMSAEEAKRRLGL